MRILLAIDASRASEAAIAEVCRRPWPFDSEIRVLAVEPPVDPNQLRGTGTLYDNFAYQERRRLIKRLNEAMDALSVSTRGLSVMGVVRAGVPRQVILEDAENWDADLIVVGSRGGGLIKRLLRGSVSLSLAANASRTVEIVREPSLRKGDRSGAGVIPTDAWSESAARSAAFPERTDTMQWLEDFDAEVDARSA